MFRFARASLRTLARPALAPAARVAQPAALAVRPQSAALRATPSLHALTARLQSTLAAEPAPVESAEQEQEGDSSGPKTYASIQGSFHAPVFRAITQTPFQYATMTDVQAEVMARLPRLAANPSVDSDVPGEIRHAQDLLVRAKTGTGKTIAFLVPALEGRLKQLEDFVEQYKKDNAGATPHEVRRALAGFAGSTVGALIISPTRELATQIANEAAALTKHLPQFGVRLLVGGASKGQQIRDWRRAPSNDIVVATPGRCVDLLQSEGSIGRPVATARLLILDEADTLLDMGFADDINTISKMLPPVDQRQTFLFSATVSSTIRQIARKSLKPDHEYIDTVPADEVDTHLHIPQFYTTLPTAEHQLEHVFRLIAHDQLLHARTAAANGGTGGGKAVVFLPTTRMTQLFAQLLVAMKPHLPWGRDTNIVEIHSKKDQRQRTRASDQFRSAKTGYSILVTSDVSARGVDYPNVTRVIQVGVPGTRDLYIHRVGRTGRAGKQGRGDLVLLPWEAGFLSWQLKDIPLKENTVGQLKRELEQLAADWDANPAEFAAPPPVSPARRPLGRHGSRDHWRTPTIPAELSPRLNSLSESLKTNVLPSLDSYDIREVFATLCGYYVNKAHELRCSKDVVLQGLKTWAVEALGAQEEPHVSTAFLQKIGMSSGKTKNRSRRALDFGYRGTSDGDRGEDRFGGGFSSGGFGGSGGGHGGGRDKYGSGPSFDRPVRRQQSRSGAHWEGRGRVNKGSSRGGRH
ncbi:RNA helicase [Rhodotorula toruloides]|uniref:ATP-dependent RNA helicase n=1 Tax=Rhodotorula toruloides TaxID=5286 RepID=A0A511KR36_RHOTO|nr:RNA helicase [Rhodotorula toruloides]